MRVRLISMSTSSRRAGECSEGSTRLAGCTGEASMFGEEEAEEGWARRTCREAAGWGGHGRPGAAYKTAGWRTRTSGRDLRLE